jgi:hypothetical protein
MKATLLTLASLMMLLSCRFEDTIAPEPVPQRILVIANFFGDQANYPLTGPCVRICIVVENMGDEAIQDTLRVDGQVRIWFKNRPEIYGLQPVTNKDLFVPLEVTSGRITLEPGQRVYLEVFWKLRTEDGRSIIDLVDYSGSPIVNGQMASQPEVLAMQGQVSIFPNMDYLQTEIYETVYIGYKSATP